jgi:hypothetical protein
MSTNDPNTTRGPSGGDVTGGAGRRDDVGPTGMDPAGAPDVPGDAEVRTPGDINAPPPGVKSDPALKNADRLERLGNEEEKPADDRYGE